MISLLVSHGDQYLYDYSVKLLLRDLSSSVSVNVCEFTGGGYGVCFIRRGVGMVAYALGLSFRRS